MTTIGIDFGTTNSVVAMWDGSSPQVIQISKDRVPARWERYGFDNLMPSVFATSPSGEARFGFEAKAQASGRFEAVKRFFATQADTEVDDTGRALLVEEVATLLFAELLHRAAQVGVAADRAVITVPANSRGLARHRTKICAGMGGVEVLALINEPTAAAMAFAARHTGDRRLLVFDWGGGTLDVTILRATDGVFIEEASKGLPIRGGIDFDARLKKLVLETVPDTSLWSAVDLHEFAIDIELAKIELSSTDETVILLPDGRSHRLTRSAFESAGRSLIEEARVPIERCLADLRITPDEIDGLVMVGGTSKIPAVRKFVSELLRRDPETGVNEMTAVSEGAAVAAAILTGESDRYDFFVGTEHALGTQVVDPDSLELRFDTLIPRNSKLPASHTKRYAPISSDQESANVVVLEGDPEKSVGHPDNVILKSWIIPVPQTEGARDFDVEFAYDVNGILDVTVTDPRSGAVILRDDVSYGVTKDRRKLVDTAHRAKRTVETGVADLGAATAVIDDPAVALLLQQASVKVIPFLDAKEAEEVRDLVQAVRTAVGAYRTAAVEALRRALAPYSYLI